MGRGVLPAGSASTASGFAARSSATMSAARRQTASADGRTMSVGVTVAILVDSTAVTPPEDPAAAARALLAAENIGVLSTISVHRPGYPYGSVTPYALSA